MPWTPPNDPVTSTVITVAYAVANLLTQIRWLRLMTGNADPPGSSYVVVSDSVSGTSWSKVPADALATGAVTTQLGYTPVNKGGDVMTGPLTVPGATVTTDLSVRRTTSGRPDQGYLILGNDTHFYIGFDGARHVVQTNTVMQVIGDLYVNRAAAPTSGYVVLGNDPARYLGYDTVSGYTAGGNPLITSANIAAQSVASAGTAVTASNATQVGGKTPTATATPNSIPISDPSGKLDAWVTPAAFSIPSGLGCWCRTAAEIPAGFARETALDGLIPIGAGTSFSQTFVEATSYGNTWQHQHGIGALSVPVSVSVSGSATGGPSDNTGQPSATGGTPSGTPPPSFGTGTHTHSLNGVSLAVWASGGGSGSTTATNTGNTTWLPPLRAVVWARKT